MKKRDLFGNILSTESTQTNKSDKTEIDNGEYLVSPDFFFKKPENDLYFKNESTNEKNKKRCITSLKANSMQQIFSFITLHKNSQ
jgi:hypothetical protein